MYGSHIFGDQFVEKRGRLEHIQYKPPSEDLQFMIRGIFVLSGLELIQDQSKKYSG
jgi:hypothetical protein